MDVYVKRIRTANKHLAPDQKYINLKYGLWEKPKKRIHETQKMLNRLFEES